MRRRRVLIVSGGSSQLDHLRWSGSLDELAGRVDLDLAAPTAIERWGHSSAVDLLTYRYDADCHAAGGRLRESGTVRRFFVLSGFRWRFLEKIFRGLEVPRRWWSMRGLRRLLRVSPTILRRAVRHVPIVLRALPGVHGLWRRRTESCVKRGCGIADVIERTHPDVVVLLFKQQDGYTLATQFACREAGVPCVVVPLKWDNATSKTTFRIPPDRLAVFSSAVGAAAARIHGLRASSIAVVGSAQAEAQRAALRSATLVPSGRDVVALGFGDPRSETRRWLPLLAQTISQRDAVDKVKVSGAAVLWRPYPGDSPTHRAQLVAAAARMPGVELDSDIAHGRSHRAESTTAENRRAAFGRYVDLLGGARLVVSGSTSAVLDARLAGLPVVIPAFRDGALLCDVPHFLRVHTHARGLWHTNGVFIAETEEEFVRLVNDFLDHPRRIPPDNSGEHIFVDERTYAQRLIDVIEDAIAEKEHERATARASRRDSSVQTSGHG